ncbi:hypothetical protein SAMN05421736_12023 [Evansella caseinilytica]|uniref:Uncharacterized protein n=1 Tax=Evansella caseinilytica TaxID=1503961 RepID=A0A1H3UBN1_9BACI|nr:hypothetical protein SAMN05421736_12023 [Evansella caseinilytica]
MKPVLNYLDIGQIDGSTHNIGGIFFARGTSPDS